MKVEVIGKQKLLNESLNVWGFEVQKDDKTIILGDKHFNSGIPLAIEEILVLNNIEYPQDNSTFKITIETL